MEIKTYSAAAKRTMSDLGTLQLNNLHMILGLGTEVGELADVFKKELAYKNSLDLVNIKEEVGDIMWYLVNFCSLNNIDLEECLGINIAKLYARFPSKFSEEKAMIRNLQEERRILESGGFESISVNPFPTTTLNIIK